MGFRDIHAFNLALLAKQVWRLIHQNHSLFFRVYKARYFPNCSFMEAELGNNQSYVWQSLLGARDILKEGTQWKVGDGQSISVSAHRWLSHKPIFLGEQQHNLMVKDLIDAHTFQWDKEKIHDLFAHWTRMEILSIPLQSNPTHDVLVWKGNKSHSFSVESAYQVAIKLQEQNQVEHSTAGKERTHWRKIWKLNVPPKVRNFIWRACSNIRPTKESLHRRRVNVDARCELCCQQPKSAGH